MSHPNEPIRALVPRAMLRDLSRRSFLRGAAVAGLGGSTLLAGCGDNSTGTDTGGSNVAAGDGELEDQLNMFTWGEYDDPKVLSAFTKSIGPKIQVDTFPSNEEMIAKLVQSKGTSGYDIVVPTGVFIPQMVENGLLLELDHSALPNMKNLAEEYLDQAWDPGNRYSVPKAWGTTGFVYDQTKIDRELTTWNDFLDAATNEASGQVSVLDDPGELTGLYFWANGIDWNTTEEEHLDAAEEYLVNTLAPHVKAFDSYPSAGMTEGRYWLCQIWNGDARFGILDSEPNTWVWRWGSPASEIWMDNWSIPAGAKNIDAAYAFIDYVLRPDVSLKQVAYVGYHTGIAGIEERARKRGMPLLDLIFPPSEELAKMTAGEVNEAQQRHVDIMNKMKAAAGR